MANWNQPALTDTYSNFLAYLDARLDDLAYGFDPAVTTVTNTPTNAIRWSSANSRWEKFSAGSWAALSSSYAISISGNAATATTLATARNINGVSFNGSANITISASTTQALTFNNGGAGVASGTTFDGSTSRTISYNTIGAPSTTGANASGTWSISISGNAATATTASACSGNSATVTNGVYTTGDQLIGGNKTFANLVTFTNGRTQVQSSSTAMWEMHIPGAHARGLYLDSAGVVRLSTTNGSGTASTQLLSIDVSGNFTATGDVAAYSDERLKQNWRDLPSDFIERLARVRMGIYERTDTGHTQVGVGAQSLRNALPWAVNEDSSGMLSVAYGNAALAACVMLAREIQAIKAKLEA